MKRPHLTWRSALAVTAVGSTIAVSLFFSSVSGPVPVAISSWIGPSYAKDVTGFHPLTDRLIADLSPSVRTVPVLPESRPSVVPSAPPVSVDQQVDPTPGLSSPSPVAGPPTPAPLQPSLTIGFSADSTKTHPNDTIVYTIHVSNAGPGTATNVVVQSHVPDGTTLAGWMCDGVKVQANGRRSFVCGDATSTPGHPVVFAVTSLAPGAELVERFWVIVNHDVRRHTDLTNHAHVYARDVDPVDSELVSVVVP